MATKMCKPVTKSPSVKLLLTTDSFKVENGQLPDKKSAFATIVFMVGILFIVEHLIMRTFLEQHKDFHPILDDEINRFILARHLGVDFVCCAAVSYVGLKSRHHLADFFTFVSSFGKIQMDRSKRDERLFKTIPGGNHVLLLFLGYQTKNLYDSYIWDDVSIFILLLHIVIIKI